MIEELVEPTGRRELHVLGVLERLRCVPRRPVEGLTRLDRPPRRPSSLSPSRPLSTYPQCGHWQRSSGSPTSNGPRSQPAGTRMNATVMSPPISWLRISTPPASSRTCASSRAIAIISPRLIAPVGNAGWRDLDHDRFPGRASPCQASLPSPNTPAAGRASDRVAPAPAQDVCEPDRDHCSGEWPAT